MKLLIRYLREFCGRMTLGFTIKVIGTVSELMLPYILSHILSDVLGREMKDIIFWGCMMLVFSGLACLLNVVANRMAADVSSRFAGKMRRDLFSKTLTLSAARTDSFTIPSLESRITTDTYNVHSFVNMAQRMGVRAPIMMIGGVSITLLMDAHLALVMIAVMPFIFATVFFISGRGVPLYSKVQSSVDSMVRVVREDAQGIRIIKALSKTDYEHRRYDTVNRKLVKAEKKAGIIMGSVNPIMTMLMNAGSVAVIAISSGRIENGLSQPETVIAFMQYFTHISMSMMAVTRMFMMYTKCAASSKRIIEVLDCEADLTIQSKSDYPDTSDDMHIIFDNVSFTYNGKKNNVENINLSLRKGSSLGIIGATGSGKTTLVKLLMRFYDVTDGSIRINGEDIRTIDKNRLCAMFGIAQQHDFLYADTIEENIRFGRDISHEEIIRAARIAQADDFITAFSDGYNHKLSQHGTNISGGQKQRLYIARAIAHNPEILILDDSSSALDYKTDAALRAALKDSLSDSTVITVAQRVSSVKDCDAVLVLEEGKIIGLGSHEELLESCTQYREISDSQMGGAIID